MAYGNRLPHNHNMGDIDEENLYQGRGLHWLPPLWGVLPGGALTIEGLNQGIQEGISSAFSQVIG
jgi:hypothetical protein